MINWFQAVSRIIEMDSIAPPPEPPEARIRDGAGVARSAALGGARANMTDALAPAGSSYGVAVVEPVQAEEKWSLADLDDHTMSVCLTSSKPSRSTRRCSNSSNVSVSSRKAKDGGERSSTQFSCQCKQRA